MAGLLATAYGSSTHLADKLEMACSLGSLRRLTPFSVSFVEVWLRKRTMRTKNWKSLPAQTACRMETAVLSLEIETKLHASRLTLVQAGF